MCYPDTSGLQLRSVNACTVKSKPHVVLAAGASAAAEPGAMQLAQQLVAGLSPVLLFLLQQEYEDFKDDLGSMFEAPPPYTTLEQLLLGCLPRVRLVMPGCTPGSVYTRSCRRACLRCTSCY